MTASAKPAPRRNLRQSGEARGMSLKFTTYDKDREGWLKTLMDLPPAPYIQNAAKVFDARQAVHVEMNMAGIASPQSKYPALGVVTVGSGMAVIARNPETGVIGLAHLTPEGQKHESLSVKGEEALREMLTMVGGEGTQVRLVGPRMRGPVVDGLIADVLEALAEYETEILSADFRGKENPNSVAVHSGLWDQGLVRGSLSVFNHAVAHGHKGEDWKRRAAEMVPLGGMVRLPLKDYSRIVYYGQDEIQSLPEPEIV